MDWLIFAGRYAAEEEAQDKWYGFGGRSRGFAGKAGRGWPAGPSAPTHTLLLSLNPERWRVASAA